MEEERAGAGGEPHKPALAAADWRAWLAGGTPREVLARIVQGDPLEVRGRVARELRERALLFDADRVHLRALARCARAAPAYRGRPALDAWVDARVSEALLELLREDDERRDEEPRGVEPDAALVALAKPLGLDPERLARACRAFNRLPVEDRRAFFRLVLERRSLDELACDSRSVTRRATRGASDGASATSLARGARRALRVLLAEAPPPEDSPAGPALPDDSGPSAADTTEHEPPPDDGGTT